MEPLGPPPFRFKTRAAVLRSAAFTWPFKCLATLIVGGCAGWLGLLWRNGALDGGLQGVPAATGVAWVVAALALMTYTWWHIITSRTELDARSLRQSWIWNKELDLRELAYVKLIRVPGLDWLIAPRLYARTLLGRFAVFYAADPRMLDEFIRLQDELKAFRSAN